MAYSYRPKPWLRWWRTFRRSASSCFVRDSQRSTAPICHFAFIGCQRSGTHLLREIINSNSSIALMAESFSITTKPVYWCNFIRTLSKSHFPALTPEVAMDVFDEYMRRIERDVQIEPEWYGGTKPNLKALGLDIKYNQLGGVTSLSMNLKSRPLLLDYFKSRDFRILHIVRRNVAKASISLILANMRNVWHNYNDASVIEGKYRISWAQLHSHMCWMKQEREEFERQSQDLPMLTCVYEDLIQDLSRVSPSGVLPEDSPVFAPMAKLFDIPNHFVYDGQMRKVVNKPYRDILENCDELAEQLRNSEFAEFADTLTSAPDSTHQSLAA